MNSFELQRRFPVSRPCLVSGDAELNINWTCLRLEQLLSPFHRHLKCGKSFNRFEMRSRQLFMRERRVSEPESRDENPPRISITFKYGKIRENLLPCMGNSSAEAEFDDCCALAQLFRGKLKERSNFCGEF